MKEENNKIHYHITENSIFNVQSMLLLDIKHIYYWRRSPENAILIKALKTTNNKNIVILQ